MKKIIFLSIFLSLIILTSCGKLGIGKNNTGELIGVSSGRAWNDPKPFGMNYIEGGSFLMGPNDQSANLEDVPTPRAVSISSFWMDATEITNSEYTQFTNWVRDSIARTRLADPAIGAMDEFYVKDKKNKADDLGDEQRPLDWNRKIPWNNPKGDESVSTALSDLYYQGGDILGSAQEINSSKLNYTFRWIDYHAAALPENKFDVNNGGFIKSAKNMHAGVDSADYYIRKDTSYFDGNKIINRSFYTELTSRSAFIQTKIVNVYPDTMCWMRDYSDSYNEPMMKMYFSHPGYQQYPVVGVTWEQADAFCRWRTQLQNSAITSKKNSRSSVASYGLPSEAQWEYAARGGKEQALYPWGGNYIRNKNGCFLANYKPLRGRYSDDGYEQTARVQSFPPNDYGLYDMAGNVAEWTADRYDESSYELMYDMNPSYQYNAKKSDPDILKRKVVRGGSWKDIGYYLECGTRTFEYQYETRSYIGFRCVKTYVGPKLFK